MNLFVLMFLCKFVDILGRALDDNTSNGAWWPVDNNMFLLPKTLKINETIDITVAAKNTTQKIDLRFLARSTQSNDDLICSYKFDMVNGTGHIYYHNTTLKSTEDLTSEEIGGNIENFITDRNDNADSDISINFKFNIGKVSNNSREQTLDLTSSTGTVAKEVKIQNLKSMRYLHFISDNAKVISMNFVFL